MTGCLKNIPEHMNWWEEFESSHDAPQAPHIDGAGGQSGRIGFLLAPWNSQKKKSKASLPTGNVVKLSHRNVAKLGGWDRILDAMGGMHWSSVSYPTPT